MKTRYLFLPFLLACSDPTSSAPAPAPTNDNPPASPSTPSALDAAHEAYLRNDWLTMNDRLRDVLVDRASSDLVRENAFELLDKAYEASSGKLPSRFELPPGFAVIKLGSKRGQHPFSTFRSTYIYVRVDKGMGAHVKELSVRSLPGNVPALDLAAGIGKLTVWQREKDSDELTVEATNVPAAIPDGVTSIHIGLDDGRGVDTWVITRGLASSSAPEITAPKQAQTFADPNPTLEWTPFHSPEWAPFEDRTLTVWVSDEKTDQPVFDKWIFQPGDLAKMKIEPKLAPGAYWFALNEGEERKFGPIYLARSSQRGVQFSVVAP